MIEELSLAMHSARALKHALELDSMVRHARGFWYNRCTACHALLLVHDLRGTVLVSGRASYALCATPVPETILQSPAGACGNSKLANMRLPLKPVQHAIDAPQYACSYCGNQTTLQTGCSKCSARAHIARTNPRVLPSKYTAPVRLNGIQYVVRGTRTWHTYVTTQHGAWHAPCGTLIKARHVYFGPITESVPEYALVINECRKCPNYQCLQVITSTID